jgi:hypothetical protein
LPVQAKGFPNAPCWRAAPSAISTPIVHVIVDGSLVDCQRLLQRRRWLRPTKSGGSDPSARCGGGAAHSGSILGTTPGSRVIYHNWREIAIRARLFSQRLEVAASFMLFRRRAPRFVLRASSAAKENHQDADVPVI